MLDHVIKGGTIVDGHGGTPYTGDVGVKDGVIVSVGDKIDDAAQSTIDAQGALVTPGWVDLHTHYDGQVSWDSAMNPSSMNGVTTVVMGNCGVGFAPVPPNGEKALIELMEGVEDIPGTALYEGMDWGHWETFPEYLDYIAGREYSLDVGAQIAHGAVRYYVMGERGTENEDATAEDMAEMARLVAEAVAAGAVGFSTSRTIGHRALWGNPVPGTFAPFEELQAICAAMAGTGKGVFEMIPSGTVGTLQGLGGEPFTLQEEHALMAQVSQSTGCKVTFTLVQSPDYPKDTWRELLDATATANGNGAQLFPQVSSRPIGFVTGLGGYHAFHRRPTYMRMAHLPLAERVAEMRKPEVREAIMSEPDVAVEEPGSMANLYNLFREAAPAIYPLADPVDYEPGMDQMLGARAAAEGREPIEVLYDFYLEDEGQAMGSISGMDANASMDVLREMLLDPNTVTGLSDAGAHVSLICDGTMPSTQLSFWARDRKRGEQLPVEFLVHKQTKRNAELYGFADRGSLTPGLRADVNVIDHDNLTVGKPRSHADLPGGGSRLIQPVSGYVATMVNGEVTRQNDTDTGNRPGRLVRSS